MPPPPRPALRTVADTTATTAPLVPAETAPTGPEVPDILAALEAGDDAAVWRWVRAHVPEAESLVLYGLLIAAGVAGLVEWPALALSALGQFVVDRRFGGVERLAADLRARAAAVTSRA